METIAKYQIGPTAQEEFPAIAYSLVVTCAGAIFLCHDLDVRTWHSGARVNGVARNASHIGIAIINDGAPPEAQLRGLVRAMVWCERELGGQLEVEGHKDAFQTICPGPGWDTWKQELLLGY